jgi:hypothetical protein
MSDPNTPAPRRLVTHTAAAAHVMVSPDTIVNWHHRGYIRAYRLAGIRGLHFDLDEIERGFKTFGPGKMRDGRKRGARGRVVPVVVVVPEGSDQ